MAKKLTPLIILVMSLLSPLSGYAITDVRVTPVVRIVREIAPAVVNINTERTVYTRSNPFGSMYGSMFDELFQDFFERSEPESLRKEDVPLSLGSGVIVDREGHVLTNEHVIVKASRIHVTIIEGKGRSVRKQRFEARLVGADPGSDVAVLKIQDKGPFPFAKLGDSGDIEIGETVIAFGDPFGLESSVTSGIVSQLGRSWKVKGHEYFDLVQTSALINPGNSGGPLVNLDGEVVAINTAIIDVREGQGLGFAIPINKAKRIVSDLIQFGKVSQSWVGLRVQELNGPLRNYFKIPNEEDGLVVTDVEKGSPAEGAGLKEKDVISFVDETPLSSRTVYWEKIREYSALKTFTLMFWRDGKKRQTKVVTAPFPALYAESMAWQRIGIRVQQVNSPLRKRYGILATQGMVIVETDRRGVLAVRGVRAGDVLVRINQYPLEKPADFERAMISIMGSDFASFLVQRGEYGYYLNVQF